MAMICHFWALPMNFCWAESFCADSCGSLNSVWISCCRELLCSSWPWASACIWRILGGKENFLAGINSVARCVQLFGRLKSSPDRNRRASLLYHMAVDSALLSALPSCSLLSAAWSLSTTSFWGRSWIMEIDYAATSQIPLPRAWPQSVWLQVGQACLRDALLAALGKGQQVRLPPQGHATCYHSKWEKITHTGRKEWRCSSQNTSPDITLQAFFYPSNSSSPLCTAFISMTLVLITDCSFLTSTQLLQEV